MLGVLSEFVPEFIMPINLSDLRKLETPSPSAQSSAVSEGQRIVAILKLAQGAVAPSYVELRAQISADLVTVEFAADCLAELERDPAVLSVSLTERVQRID